MRGSANATQNEENEEETILTKEGFESVERERCVHDVRENVRHCPYVRERCMMRVSESGEKQ